MGYFRHNFQTLAFYDIEVYPYDSFVVFKNIKKETIGYFSNKNNFEGLAEFIEGKTLVGFNNYHYDDRVLHNMARQLPQGFIKALNDKIINGDKMGFLKPTFISIDVREDLLFSVSLKKTEANRGKMIKESSVPFDIPRPLTEAELIDCIAYCDYDVEQTIDLYLIRKSSWFDVKDYLLSMCSGGTPDVVAYRGKIRWSKKAIIENIILGAGANPLHKWEDFTIGVDNNLKDKLPDGLFEFWKQRSEHLDKVAYEEKQSGKKWKPQAEDKSKFTVEMWDNVIDFALGGVHGVNNTKRVFKNVYFLDVESMYPNIMILLEILGVAGTQRFKEILEERIVAKKAKDSIKSNALKLIINTIYGYLGFEFTKLFSRQKARSVCFFGQASLYYLCELVSPFVDIVNINTDGIGFTLKDGVTIETIEEIKDTWEQEINLKLDWDKFDVLVQKDVNNYIGLDKSEKDIEDQLKLKGGDVGQYLNAKWDGNASNRIIHKGLVDYILYGKSARDTVLDHLEQPELFQIILAQTGKYIGVFDERDNQYNKVNRVFASEKGVTLLKRKAIEDAETGEIKFQNAKFANAPDVMRVWNEDFSDLDENQLHDFMTSVDIQFYIDLINDKIEKWKLGGLKNVA